MLRTWIIGLLPICGFFGSFHSALSAAALPRDPLDLATSSIRNINTADERAEMIHLLDRAAFHYRLRSAGFPYDLKISFVVQSGGRTQFDGEWEMEDLFDPSQGLRWSARTKGYSIIQISDGKMTYQESPAGPIPLRLHEARVHLLGPMMSETSMETAALRSASANYNGQPLTCILLSPERTLAAAGGREWNETVECIDPRTELLRFHSPAPGLYIRYDYENALQFHEQILPRQVTVVESGKPVIEEHLTSLDDLPTGNSALFTPTEQMKARGAGTNIVGLLRNSVSDAGHLTTGSAIVFGLLSETGKSMTRT